MTRIVTLLMTCSLLWACNSAPTKEESSCCEKKTEIKDSVINPDLQEWATFFDTFSTSLKNKEFNEHVYFPLDSYDGPLKNETFFNDENVSSYFPKSFINICLQANKELSKELQKFENNKLYKYTNSESGHYKLIIDYAKDNVKVTHFRALPKTKNRFEQYTYTFHKGDKYLLHSITK